MLHKLAIQREKAVETNQELVQWVDEVASRTRPDKVIWCDGSEEEYYALVDQMVKENSLIRLNENEFPRCYLYRSEAHDVARTESSTYICTPYKADAGPTNNWMSPESAQAMLWDILEGSMRGRTMFVVPYIMGPLDSIHSQVGVEITDSSYVAISLRIMTRMGSPALERLKNTVEFVKGIHSMGTSDPTKKYICHFPDSKLIMSVNSNYGGNALLSKKAHSLRIASISAREEGWMAEHMLILGIQDKNGRTSYITGAFPSASGKTNLAMLRPPDVYSGYKVLLIGDDIAWLHLGADRRLYAINPEAGFFCVATHTSPKTNPNLLETIKRDTIFTNVALAPGQIPWWEGKEPAPDSLIDWHGNVWKPGGAPAAHPNSRFTVAISNYPALSPKFKDPEGVPISAMLFGGRRASLVPLVYEALNWEHGVLIGAMMKIETTAAAEGKVGVLRNDPMAMTPFCGYNMGDYFQYWLDFANRSKNLPKIFQVNWFRLGADKRFLWPGYGDNMRVLEWIVNRANQDAPAVKTPIGYLPTKESLNLKGLNLKEKIIDELLLVDRTGWLKELEEIKPYFESFGDRFPKRLWQEYDKLASRLKNNS
ncbi:MAG: phosphoenolpyruvate carboxykinase (GTP) [Nitrososphaerota archaeon]|nr:phosphoenolpyruvate carboxykinase (GTP) [Nitrososphaerota archaeon]